MRKLCNTLLSALSYVLGVFGWVYIGVWKILTKPVKYVVLAQLAGELSARGILGAFVQGFLYLVLTPTPGFSGGYSAAARRFSSSAHTSAYLSSSRM